MQQNRSKFLQVLIWGARIIAAIILLQTLWFKFGGAEESKFIFSKLGIEPWGRIGSGVAELIAAILILIPRTSGIGALMGLGVISGALLSHVFVLGIAVKNSDGSSDGGLLFLYACIVFVACLFLVWIQRNQIPVVKNLFR